MSVLYKETLVVNLEFSFKEDKVLNKEKNKNLLSVNLNLCKALDNHRIITKVFMKEN